MPIVKYIEADGSEHDVEVAVGGTLMQAAVDNMVNGILAECGGACACATCHCFVDEQWTAKTGEASEMEKGMLKYVDGLMPNSRLSCQIDMTEEMDGLVVMLPESQGY